MSHILQKVVTHMPKEKMSLSSILLGDEPGPISRIVHSLSGDDEGSWGEKCIATLLKNRTEGTSIFQNVYIPTEDGTTELDLVMTHVTGIYVFESKAYGGTIYGKLDHMTWIQYIGGQKNTFYNPIRQNKNHCIHLSQALKIPLEKVVSFIVFENRTDLSKLPQAIGNDFTVCKRNKLIQYLKETLKARNAVFSNEELSVICNTLKQWCKSDIDPNIQGQHIEYVKTKMFSEICPICGKTLVERKGKYGNFIGCSGYPSCKYTRELKSEQKER